MIKFKFNQGSGVVPGQAFGIQPRIQPRNGRKKEEERSGNDLTDVLSDAFPVDRIPIQFRGTHQLHHIVMSNNQTVIVYLIVC